MQTLRWRLVYSKLTGKLGINSYRRQEKGRRGRRFGQRERLKSNAVSMESSVKSVGSPEVGMTLLNCPELG